MMINRNQTKILLFVAIAMVLAATASPAQAGTRWWDGGTANISGNGNGASGGGNGTWNTALLNWDAGASPHVAWVNANNDTAVFDGTAGTVTVGAGITVGGLTFDTANYTTAGDTLTFGVAGSITANANATISSSLAGSAAITKTGAGTLTLSGANTYSGGLWVNAGTLQFNSATAIGGSGRSVTVASGTTIAVNYAIDNTFLNRLVESANTFSINLLVASALALDLSSSTGANLPNAVLTAPGNFTYSGALTPGGNTFRLGNLNTTAGFQNATVFTVSSSLSGAGNSVVISGTSPVYLTGTLTYGGTTTVNPGAAAGFSATSLDGMGGGPASRSILVGDGASVLRSGGSLNNAFLQRLVLTTNAFTITANNAGCGSALDLTGLPNVSLGTWDNVGTGTFAYTGTITPANNTYRFGGPRAGNVINLNNANSLTGARSLVVGGATLKLNAVNDFSGDTLIKAGTLYVANNLGAQNSTIDTSGAGVMNVTGATTPTFGGLKGSKNIGALITTGYGSVTALTLNPGAGVTNTYSGIIANGAAGMALTKSGLGTQILSGANTYTGATTNSAGRLLVNGSLAADSTVTVTGGTLGGTGTIYGPVNVQGGGTLAPGDFVGTLNVSNVTLSGVLAIDINETQPGICDTLAVSDDLSIAGATLNLTITGDTIQPEYVIATYGVLTGTFAAINGLPAGWAIDYAYGEGNVIAIVPPPPTAPPTVPAGLTATNGLSANGSTSFVRLNWSPSSGAAGYNVKRSLSSGGPYAQIATTLLKTCDDMQASIGVTNYYVVSAVNSFGESANSAQASAVPVAPPPPATPSGLSASSTNGVINLAWNATFGAGGYLIKRGLSSGGPYSPIGVTAATTYPDSHGVAGTTYYYVVAATNSGGISANSAEVSATVAADPLLAALAQLKNHIRGVTNLTTAEIQSASLTISAQGNRFAESSNTIAAVFDLVRTYDQVKGPLWIATGNLTRSTANNDLTWTIYFVMQNTMDKIYNPQALTNYAALLNGFKFNSSSNFPGACAPPANSNQTYTATINASYPDTWGWPTQGDGPDTYARKPTGTYLAPGTIATVTVPASLVGKGYRIRVGCHSWDFSNKPSVNRLDRVSLLYDINALQTSVANPLGGGIYIEVPFLASNGVVNVQIRNAVRSPYFSAKSFHATTLSQWLTERTNAAPWADFQSDKFMIQVPRSWIYALDDPVTLMANWDIAMDTINDLMGFPHLRGKETIYDQVDLLLRGSAYFPGYPTGNNTYSPSGNYGGYANSYLVRGPQYAPDYEFHEQGHAYFFPKLGEVGNEKESVVNLLHVAVWHQRFGYSLDEAFRRSRSGYPAYATLDTTAVAWMACGEFLAGIPMGSAGYQLKGHAKFVETARLFGWDTLNRFWYSYTSDYENSGTKPSPSDDDYFLRLSKVAGVDMRPLFHFWGAPPVNANALNAAIAAANLPASPAIYDALVHYQSLVPANNAAFTNFAFNWWGHVPSTNGYSEERDHANLWNTYSAATCATLKARAQQLTDLYYPNGRPALPAAPTGLAAVGTNALVKLTWGVATNATSYNIKRALVTGGPYSPLGMTATTNYNDSAVTNGVTYYYVVSATNVFGESTNSAQASATPVAPPLIPPVLSGFGPLGGTSFPLTFSGPSGQSYQVLSSTNLARPLASWTVLKSGTFGAGPVTFTDTGATNKQQFYRIQSP
jgi:autotransporter-associated beta strand protein